MRVEKVVLIVILLCCSLFARRQKISDSLYTQDVEVTNATILDTIGDSICFFHDGHLSIVHKDSLAKYFNPDSCNVATFAWDSDSLEGHTWQDVVDLLNVALDSAKGASYAEIHNHDDTITTSIPTGDTYTKLPVFPKTSLSLTHIADTANDRIIIGRSGVNFVIAHVPTASLDNPAVSDESLGERGGCRYLIPGKIFS